MFHFHRNSLAKKDNILIVLDPSDELIHRSILTFHDIPASLWNHSWNICPFLLGAKMKRIQKLNLPYKKDVRKIANINVSIHEKRKVLQTAKLGEALSATLEDIIIPLLNGKY